MAERNAWVIERIDLGVLMVQDYDVLGADKSAPYPMHVVRYDFTPTKFPLAKPFSVRFQHFPAANQERVEFEEWVGIGQAIRNILTSGRTASMPSSAGSSEPPPTA